jgi:hypothetical protein
VHTTGRMDGMLVGKKVQELPCSIQRRGSHET